jgi:hypothetical protein
MRVPLAFLMMLLLCSVAAAGPKEDAYAAIERWSQAFNDGTADDTAAVYSPEASLWGTMATSLTTTPEAVKKYFSAGAGVVKVKLGEHHSAQLSDTVVVNVGKYDFSRTRDGQVSTFPARYTFVLAKHGEKWVIVHHHSSLIPKPAQ